jgi:hypothetical protein
MSPPFAAGKKVPFSGCSRLRQGKKFQFQVGAVGIPTIHRVTLSNALNGLKRLGALAEKPYFP